MIAGKVIIGDNCTLHQNTTIGRSFGLNGGTPIIGNNVVIFTGCQIGGKVRIGDNVIIGAGSVVIKNTCKFCCWWKSRSFLSENSSDERICSQNWLRYFN